MNDQNTPQSASQHSAASQSTQQSTPTSASKTTTGRQKNKVMYALSIHMKYGEVFHLEGLNKEEKDRYFELARNENDAMLVEDKASIVHLLSRDIAKISVKAYDEKYEKIYHPIEKLLFSESSMGRRVFSIIIKSFIAIAFLAIMGMFGLAVIEGNIMDVFFDGELFTQTILKGFDLVNKIFLFTIILMFVLNVIDIALGSKAHYFINQDGADPVEYSRLSNALVTVTFLVVFIIIKTILSTVAGMI